MFCTSCGAANPDDAAFCAKCGRPLLPAPADKTTDPLATAGLAPGGRYAPSATTLDDSPRMGMGTRGDAGAITEEEAWSAYIGERNTAYYLDRFERMKRGGSAPWHWPGFFVTWYWMLYRKLWLAALAYFFLPTIVMAVLEGIVAASSRTPQGLAAGMGVLWVVYVVAWLAVPALIANRLVYGKAKKVIARARAAGGTRERVLMRIAGEGGTSNIVVIVIAVLSIVFTIGILAAVALPAYQTYTLKAKVSEAQGMGNEVTALVGRTYEETGALPADIDAVVREAHSSSHRYVTGVHMDPGNGIVTLDVSVDPRHEGHLVYLPHADDKRHVTWQCTTPDLQKLVTASCKNETPQAQQ